MKSVFNKIEKEKPKEIQFPVLAEHIEDGTVVLFINYTRGVVVHGYKNSFINKRYENHNSVEHTSIWRILSPEEYIVLSND